jgi:putative CocE/NonD family hydrolase
VGVTLHAATSASDTDFTAKLCDVSPEGRSTNIQEGIVRARYRESLSEPTPITPEEVYEYRLDLGPTAHVFKAGHRIRVQISSSDFPQWDRNLNTGGLPGAEGAAQARVATQTVLHDAGHPSRVTLPVLGR